MTSVLVQSRRLVIKVGSSLVTNQGHGLDHAALAEWAEQIAELKRRNREVLIDCTSFGNINPYTLRGILRHELGHVLGFRHEHTRPEAGTCFEDNSWRPLTPYDSSSVMHYPQCNGSNPGDLTLTDLDD